MPWTTNNEIEFLRKLGTYGSRGRDPKVCLEGYIKSAEKREFWDRVAKHEVVKMAKAMLESM